MAKAKRVRVGDWPKLTRFYGLTPREIARTPHAILKVYADQLEELEAAEQLQAMSAVLCQNSEQEELDRVIRKLRRRAGYVEPVETVDVSTEDGAAALASLGIGIKVG